MTDSPSGLGDLLRSVRNERGLSRQAVAQALNVGVRAIELVEEGEIGSDLDLLVEPTRDTSLFDIGGIQFEVSQLLGIEVDVLTPRSLPESFKATVLAEALPL